MRFHRPIGIFLLLWPALIALYLAANGTPDLKTLCIFIFGVIVMRAAGCVINDYADRNVDSHVARTQNRPLATKQIAPKSALRLFLGLMALALILATQLKIQTLLLAFGAASLTLIYPFMKRITGYPQLILGLAFAWSIPMAYMQVTDHLSAETWILFGSVIAWVVAYDTQYAMADISDDLKIGVKSSAISFGKYDKFIICFLQLICVCGFVILGLMHNFSLVYYTILSLTLVLIIYQQWLIKDRLPKNCMAAFLNNNYLGALLFIACYKAVH